MGPNHSPSSKISVAFSAGQYFSWHHRLKSCEITLQRWHIRFIVPLSRWSFPDFLFQHFPPGCFPAVVGATRLKTPILLGKKRPVFYLTYKNPCLCWISPAQTRILRKHQRLRVFLPGNSNSKRIVLTQCSNERFASSDHLQTGGMVIRAQPQVFQSCRMKQARKRSIACVTEISCSGVNKTAVSRKGRHPGRP